MSAPTRRAAARSRIETSLGELRELIALARRVNALAAQHGIAVDDARRLAQDELDARPTREGRAS